MDKLAKPDTERLLDIAQALAVEARQGTATPPPRSLDAELERDYGFDSLTRMELMRRVEREFGLTLPERLLAEADTLRDLLQVLTQGRAAAPAVPEETARLTGTSAADKATTLVEALAWHARHHPEQLHVRFYADDGDGEALTYGALWEDAGRIASGLAARGVGARDAVVIMLPSGRDYFASFFGVLRAGGVPVPVYPPGRPREIEDHIRRHAKIAGNARARLMVTVAEAKPFSRALAAQTDALAEIVTCDELRIHPMLTAWPTPKPGDPAFIQYTSGSTGDPKGVVLTHANLIANVTAMGRVLQVTPNDVFVSWLPLYHDMGLIGAWLGSLVHGIPLVLMSPLIFLARPQRWLHAISRYRGTISGAPNFAYETCATRLDDKDLAGVDLSSWRVAFNGAEPVSPTTLELFAERFRPYGFRREAIMPVYGLAEDSVGLAFPPLERGPRIDRIDRDALLKSGRAVTSTEADAKLVVACGLPLPGHQIRVVDESSREVPDRVEGRVQFQGPSATSGYLRNPEANAVLFDGPWLNSGDLGYTVAGEIHITGRTKDMIIRAGRNIFPAELEAAIGALDGVGAVAVFGSPDPANGTERLVVMAETRRPGAEAQDKLTRAINELAHELIGMPPDLVKLVPPRSVPKTSSGKIRRQAARQAFESNTIGAAGVKLQMVRLGVSALGPSLRRSARRGVHALANVWSLVFGAVVAAVGYSAVVLLPVESWRWAMLKALVRFYCAGIGVRFRTNGALPKTPAVICVNHSSYFDGPAVVAALPRPASFIAKGELRANAFTHLFLARLGTIFVDRFNASRAIADAGTAAEALKHGRPIVYFPEGTLSRMAGLLPFQLGAFLLAVRSHVPIVPLVVRGTRQVLRDGSWVPQPHPIEIDVLDPISPSATDDEWTAAVALRDRVRAAFLAKVGEPDLAYERPLNALAKEAKATDTPT